MAGIRAFTTVYARNGLGQFIAECEGAATATVSKLASDGAQMSRALAPVETGELKGSIGWVVLSRTSAAWYASAAHALPQEFGASAHIITGSPSLRFFWEREGRMWIPAADLYGQPGLVDVVHHPGNPAHPFLRPSYQAQMAKAISVADAMYPG